MNMQGKFYIHIGIVLLYFVAVLTTTAFASAEYVEVSSEYEMQKNDTLEKAKEYALRDALRNAVERAGVYVESYSKVNDLKLSDDQIRIIAGNVIKLEEKKFVVETKKDNILIHCYIKTIIDTEKIDLKLALEQKLTKEENEMLNIKIKEAENKIAILKYEYNSAKNDNERLKIRNELLAAENDLGGLYKQNLGGKNVLEEIKGATKYYTNIAGIGTKVTQDELVRNVENKLFNSGWKKYAMFKNLRWIYIRPLDEYFIEVLDIPKNTNEGIQLMIGTNSEEDASKLYRVAYSELETLYGKPLEVNYSDKICRAEWETRLHNSIFKFGVRQYEDNILQYFNINNSDKKFWISIWKSSEEINKIDMTKHTQYSIEKTIKAVNHNTGIWYDENGNKQLIISNGQINGCKVIAGFDFAGGALGSYGIYRIQEKNGVRDIKLVRVSRNMLVIDDKINLINTLKPQYKISVNGVYLGMHVKEMYSKLGNPDIVKNDVNDNCYNMEYIEAGLKIYTAADRVLSIGMKNNKKWRLDGSGLNYLNSPSEFVRYYNLISGYTTTSYIASESEYLIFDSFPAELVLATQA